MENTATQQATIIDTKTYQKHYPAFSAKLCGSHIKFLNKALAVEGFTSGGQWGLPPQLQEDLGTLQDIMCFGDDEHVIGVVAQVLHYAGMQIKTVITADMIPAYQDNTLELTIEHMHPQDPSNPIEITNTKLVICTSSSGRSDAPRKAAAYLS